MWARAAVLLVALAGCGKQLNPLYCAENPDDGDCRDAGLAVVDARLECLTSADCMDPLEKVCELATHNCVQCEPGGDTSACTGTLGMNCGDDRLCHGCLVDSHCPDSFVCQASGECADAANVLYAAPGGAGNCTLSAPCTFTQAVGMVSPAKRIIKLTTTSGFDYTEPPITLSAPQNVTILGTATTFTPNESGDAISVTAGVVEIVGLAINGTTGGKSDGVHCTAGEILLRRMSITGSPGYGVEAINCKTTIERTRLSLNKDGGLSVSDSTVEARNNIIDANGDNKLVEGNTRFVNATGRFVFNTVVRNSSEQGGGGRTSGVYCTVAGMLVGHNIVVANGPANESISQTCTRVSNYVSTDINSVRFANLGMNDYHLTAMTPNPQIREDSEADANCRVGNAYIDDFDGQARPLGLCDRGADEYRP